MAVSDNKLIRLLRLGAWGGADDDTMKEAADRIEALVEAATRYRDERAMVDDTPAFCALDAALRGVKP